MSNTILTQNAGVTGGNTLVMAGNMEDVRSAVFIPNILNMDSNYVVLDYGGSVLSRTGAALAKNGYDVKVLDMINFSHHTYNPFKYLNNKMTNIMQIICNLMASFFPHNPNEKECKLLLEALLYHVYCDAESSATLADVYRLLEIISEPKSFTELLKDDEFWDKIKEKYVTFIETGGENTGKIMMSALEAMETLNTDDVVFTTSSNSVELEKILRPKYALFVLLPENNSEYEFIFPLILSQLTSILNKSKKPSCQVKFFLGLSANTHTFSLVNPDCIDFKTGNHEVIVGIDCFKKEVLSKELFQNIAFVKMPASLAKPCTEQLEIGEDEIEKIKTLKAGDVFVMSEKLGNVLGRKYDVKKHLSYSAMKESFEDFEKDKREFKGLLLKEVMLQFILRIDIEPERIKKIASYSKYSNLEEKQKILKDAYEVTKSLLLSRDFRTLVSYVVRTCDCKEEFLGSAMLLRQDAVGYASAESMYNWYKYLSRYLESKISIMDPTCDFHPQVLQYIIYFLTLDRTPVYCDLYEYFYPDKDDGYNAGTDYSVELEDDSTAISLGSRDLGTISDDAMIKTTDENCDETGYNEEKVKECLAELDALVGLDKSVTSTIHEIVNIILGNRMRVECGNKPFPINSYHICFTGSPGTGKTTVARIYAKLLHYCGILNKGDLLEVGRSDLIGGYLGQSGLKTKQALTKAKGGVLFIDEAYSLMSRNDDSYGSECISVLVQNMENMKNEIAIILAGYTKEMNDFLKTNPGLKSRIYNVVEFKDYDIDELIRIFDKMCNEKDLVVSDEIRECIKKKIILASKEKEFGNARSVRNFVDTIVKSLLARTVNDNLKGADQNIITEADTEKIVIKTDTKKPIGFN